MLGAAQQWRGEAGQVLDAGVLAQLRRCLSPQHTRLRVWGAQRFDSQGPVAPHWEAFGSYLFVLPLCAILALMSSDMKRCLELVDTQLHSAWFLHTSDSALPACRLDYVEASSCSLLSCTLAWDTASRTGNSSLEQAVQQALAALAALRPPASLSAPAFQVRHRAVVGSSAVRDAKVQQLQASSTP